MAKSKKEVQAEYKAIFGEDPSEDLTIKNLIMAIKAGPLSDPPSDTDEEDEDIVHDPKPSKKGKKGKPKYKPVKMILHIPSILGKDGLTAIKIGRTVKAKDWNDNDTKDYKEASSDRLNKAMQKLQSYDKWKTAEKLRKEKMKKLQGK